MVSELVRDISDGHRAGATLHPGRRAGWWGLPLALLAAMTVSAEAWSMSGETEDTLGAHQAAGSACSALRTASGLGPNNGDLYLVCNGDRGRADAEPCDVYSLSTLVRGHAVGFCADSFMGRQVRAVNVAEPVLEEGKRVSRTSFGANLGLTRGGARTDVICVTFAGAGSGAGASQGNRVCVEVYKDGHAENPAQCGPSGGPSLRITSNGCNTIEQQLRATITGGGQVPVFSHALLSNAIANVGGANSHALFVCQQHNWRCADEAGASAIDYWVPFADTQSPGCKTMSGVRYCW